VINEYSVCDYENWILWIVKNKSFCSIMNNISLIV
jgi:hypothetical protein